MSLHEIPAEVLRDLLLNVEGEISPASPFAFLFTDEVEGELEPHLKWLEKNKLLQSPAKQNGRVALEDPLRRSLDILARPVRRIVVSEVTADGPRRSVHVSDGFEVVVAMFNETHCLVSDPLELEAFRDGVLAELGPPAKSRKAPEPIRTHPSELALLGSLAGEWAGPGADEERQSFAALEWPVSRSLAEERTGALLGDSEAALEALDAMTEDEILREAKGELSIHPSFKPYHAALTSSTFMEIQRLEYPDSSLENLQPLVRAYFAGPQGARCLIWPADGETGDVILSQPSVEELKSFVNYLVGYLDPDESED